MSHRPGRRRSYRQRVNCDLELRPLMNVFIVLIPMLLMSAVFVEIRTIEMSLPQASAAAAQEPPLDLAVHIRADAYVIEANGVPVRAVARSRTATVPGAATSAEITAALAQIVAVHPQHDEVRIVAESTTRYQEIVAVMDLARAAGLPRAALESAGSAGA